MKQGPEGQGPEEGLQPLGPNVQLYPRREQKRPPEDTASMRHPQGKNASSQPQALEPEASTSGTHQLSQETVRTVFGFLVASDSKVGFRCTEVAKPGGAPGCSPSRDTFGLKHSLPAELMLWHDYVTRRVHSASATFYTYSSAFCVPRTGPCHALSPSQSDGSKRLAHSSG